MPAAPTLSTSAAPSFGPGVQGPSSIRALEPKTPGRWIVDSSGASNADTPYLAEAVANAKPDDLILLKPGTYAGHVKIEKPLTIKADPPGQAIVVGHDESALNVRMGRVTLEDLIIEQQPAARKQAALETRAPGSLVLKRLHIRGAYEGVRVISGRLEVIQSTFTSKGDGITLREGGLRCAGCFFSGNNIALWVGRDARDPVELLDSRIMDTSYYSVYVSGAKNVLIERTEFRRNKYGVYVSDGNLVMRRVTLSEGGSSLLSINRTAVVQVEDSVITAAAYTGISATDESRLVLRRCRIQGNGSYGISLAKQSRLAAFSNDFSGNGRGAFEIRDEAHIEGQGNTPPLPGETKALPAKKMTRTRKKR